MPFNNSIGPQVCCRRYVLALVQSTLATRLELTGFDISRSGVSKLEARLRFVDDKDLMFLAEVLKVPIQELFPRRESAGRLSDFMASWKRRGSDGSCSGVGYVAVAGTCDSGFLSKILRKVPLFGGGGDPL